MELLCTIALGVFGYGVGGSALRRLAGLMSGDKATMVLLTSVWLWHRRVWQGRWSWYSACYCGRSRNGFLLYLLDYILA